MSVVPETNPEQALLETGNFRYTPQTPTEIAEDLANMEIHIMRGHMMMDYSQLPEHVDTVMAFVTSKPRKVGEEHILSRFLRNKLWWAKLNLVADEDESDAYNPFDLAQQDTYVISTDNSPSTLLYNFSEGISEEALASIRDTYHWYEREFAGGLSKNLPAIIVGDHLGMLGKEFSGLAAQLLTNVSKRPILGSLHHLSGEKPDQTAMSINSKLFEAQSMPNRWLDWDRYSELYKRGVPLVDIILTHEFAHALVLQDDPQAHMYEEWLDWQTQTTEYKRGRWPRRRKEDIHLTGQGKNYPAAPPTNYGYTNAAEDFAESMVFYRYAPELLDDKRHLYMEGLKLVGRWSPALSRTVEVTRLSEPIYPYQRIPKVLGAHVIKASHVQNLARRFGSPEEIAAVVRMQAEIKGQQ